MAERPELPRSTGSKVPIVVASQRKAGVAEQVAVRYAKSKRNKFILLLVVGALALLGKYVEELEYMLGVDVLPGAARVYLRGDPNSVDVEIKEVRLRSIRSENVDLFVNITPRKTLEERVVVQCEMVAEFNKAVSQVHRGHIYAHKQPDEILEAGKTYTIEVPNFFAKHDGTGVHAGRFKNGMNVWYGFRCRPTHAL